MKTSNTYLKTKETAIEQPHTETVTVMGEIKSMRSANEKHFRLTDGSCAAVAYPYPAHYRTSSGTWEELKNKPELKDGSYAVHAGAVEKMFPEKLERSFSPLSTKSTLSPWQWKAFAPPKPN